MANWRRCRPLSRRSRPACGAAKRDLADLNVLITAGPTTSPIDAVRYITNHSTGRMGAAMAEEALRRGAEVRYVLGVDKGVVRPVAPRGSADRLTLVEVRTAEEMAAAALAFLPDVNGVIATAAVLDYRVANPAPSKLKRAAEDTVLDMVPSVDVLGCAAGGGHRPVVFRLCCRNRQCRGQWPRQARKQEARFSVRQSGGPDRRDDSETGFSVPTNAGTLLRAGRRRRVSLPVMSKTDLARRLWDLIV